MQFPTGYCRKLRVNLLKNGTGISISTVSRRLRKEFGLKCHKPAAKPCLTSTIKKKLLFANIHLQWNVIGNIFIFRQIYSSAVCSEEEARLKTKMAKIQCKVLNQ